MGLAHHRRAKRPHQILMPRSLFASLHHENIFDEHPSTISRLRAQSRVGVGCRVVEMHVFARAVMGVRFENNREGMIAMHAQQLLDTAQYILPPCSNSPAKSRRAPFSPVNCR